MAVELIRLPGVPVKPHDLLQFIANNNESPIHDLLQPYHAYEAKLREIYAQQPSHPLLADSYINAVALFNPLSSLTIQPRDLSSESEAQKEKYLLALKQEDRRAAGTPAIVSSMKAFQSNFNLFSEASLTDLVWSNVVAAGSSVVTSLMPVPEKYAGSKRALREYYHQKIAPASDVDLFLYGLTEDEAVEKIKQIEQSVRDSVLQETTTIRTKNAVTIVSQYPTRHVQIVLRIYKSISEILTGFDVDCSCAAYDGKQVYATPRALAAYVTQRNTIDLSRRSPSYENRLSKYSRRGFEVYWPELERSRIDPTIFERSFSRTLGLARLLVLEKLPKNADREAYLDQRRIERGRPPVNDGWRREHSMFGNLKDDQVDEVAEWVTEDEVSDYHTFTIPYGTKFHAKKIERLLYAKDLLLNAEWNKKADREVRLHRHPAFFGQVTDIIGDCCGYCPVPSTPEELRVAQDEEKIYVGGKITFMHDNPGRQAIGSFNPITTDDWIDMAYVGDTARLCQAIVDADLEYVKQWCTQEGVNINQRDYTGRTLLHLAVISSTPEIVQCLIDCGARIVARLVDGKTALHLAAIRGSLPMVKSLLLKSEENKEKEAEREVHRDQANPNVEEPATNEESESEESDVDMMSDQDESDNGETLPATDASFVNIRSPKNTENLPSDDEDEPDVYDIDVETWDAAVTALHFAIINGRTEVVRDLVDSFGSNVTIPVKVRYNDRSPRGAILAPVLTTNLAEDAGRNMMQLLLDLGASCAQADLGHVSVLHYVIAKAPGWLDILFESDGPAVQLAINQLAKDKWQTPLTTAIMHQDEVTTFKLLDAGASPVIRLEDFTALYHLRHGNQDLEKNMEDFRTALEQPVLTATRFEMAKVVTRMLDEGADPNTLTAEGWTAIQQEWARSHTTGSSLLDIVREKLAKLSDDSEPEPTNTPKPLRDDAAYLSGLNSDTYKFWKASSDLTQAKQVYRVAHRTHEEQEAAEKKRVEPYLSAKFKKIERLRSDFEALEATIVFKGGKTFAELHPDISSPDNSATFRRKQLVTTPKEFEIKFTFHYPDLQSYRQEGYEALFEAAWAGDLNTIKTLTLARWGPDQDRMPLQIAVTDGDNMSTFALAVYRGHMDVAKAILEIAMAQYAPGKRPNTSYRVSLGSNDEDEDDDDTDEEVSSAGDDEDGYKVGIRSHLVDEQFTVDLLSTLGQQVKSKVKPTDMLYANLPIDRFFEDGSVEGFSHQSKLPWESEVSQQRGRTPSRSLLQSHGLKYDHFSRSNYNGICKVDPGTLLKYATIIGDSRLATFLLDLGAQFTTLESVEDHSKIPWVSTHDFVFALKLGRVQIVAEMMRRAGSGIPLATMAKESGVELPDRPKYYQGLSVYGKKRADWATKAEGVLVRSNTEFRSPLLEAARFGSIESVEWLLSDAPLRYYLEFVETYHNDKSLRVLAKTAGGAKGAIEKFLASHSELLVHCAVLAPPKGPRHKLLDYTISTARSLLNAKSPADSHTPLHIAFSLAQPDAALALIKAGADQTARDKHGDNIIHFLLVPIKTIGVSQQSSARISEMLKLIDPRIFSSLLLERGSGLDSSSTTPLAKWISRHSKSGCNTPIDERQTQILASLLEASPGDDLEMIDGSGDTPLHVAVRNHVPEFVDLIAARKPALLWRENATGRTPFEMARDSWMSDVFSGPPQIDSKNRRNIHRHGYYCSRISEYDSTVAPPEEFDTTPKSEKQRLAEMSAAEATWRVCERMAQRPENRGLKRKLVSLTEANEVARRLAAREKWSRSAGKAEVLRDEIDDFFPEAQAWNLQG